MTVIAGLAVFVVNYESYRRTINLVDYFKGDVNRAKEHQRELRQNPIYHFQLEGLIDLAGTPGREIAYFRIERKNKKEK